jgi:hypothetical protein
VTSEMKNTVLETIGGEEINFNLTHITSCHAVMAVPLKRNRIKGKNKGEYYKTY